MAASCPVWRGRFGGIVVSVAPASVIRYHPKERTKTLCPVQGSNGLSAVLTLFCHEDRQTHQKPGLHTSKSKAPEARCAAVLSYTLLTLNGLPFP